MNYYIRMQDNSILPVDRATPFIYEGIQLFTWYRKSVEEFQVVEATTGLLLSSCTTEEEALNTAKEYIIKVGLDKTKEKIAEIQKKINFNMPKPIANMEML